MLLTFDIGNTNIKTALFDGDKLVNQWRLHTDARRTSDEYFSLLRSLFREDEIDFKRITNAIISSVVPNLIGPFISVSQRIIGKKPWIVSPDIFDKLPVKVPKSGAHEIGGDLLCDALEAWLTFREATIVADFGTALSFTAIDNQGNIVGIAITPGIGTALNSLFSSTAQLPSVALEIPESSLGTNTIECIQSGILFGYKGLVEGLIAQMKKDLAQKHNIDVNKIHTIATGGLNSMLAPISNVFERLDKELTLNGLRDIAKCLGC